MGNRRIGRKRLYGVEKAGQKIDLESGAGIKDAVKSATQHRQGQEIITEILVDLGTSRGAGIQSGGAVKKALGLTADGTSATYAYLTKLSVLKFGYITEVRVVCLEDVAADTAGTDIDIFAIPNASDPDQKDQGDNIADVSSAVALFTGGAAVVLGRDDTYSAASANLLADHYVYIANGAAGSGAMSSGKLAIYIHGFVAPADL